MPGHAPATSSKPPLRDRAGKYLLASLDKAVYFCSAAGPTTAPSASFRTPRVGPPIRGPTITPRDPYLSQALVNLGLPDYGDTALYLSSHLDRAASQTGSRTGYRLHKFQVV
jgi:hypothetical protein